MFHTFSLNPQYCNYCAFHLPKGRSLFCLLLEAADILSKKVFKKKTTLQRHYTLPAHHQTVCRPIWTPAGNDSEACSSYRVLQKLVETKTRAKRQRIVDIYKTEKCMTPKEELLKHLNGDNTPNFIITGLTADDFSYFHESCCSTASHNCLLIAI